MGQSRFGLNDTRYLPPSFYGRGTVWMALFLIGCIFSATAHSAAAQSQSQSHRQSQRQQPYTGGDGLIISAEAIQRAFDAWQRGADALSAGNWDVAVAAFRLCLLVWPDHPDVSALLGVALYHTDDRSGARDALRVAIAGNTKYLARALYYDGLAASETNDPDAAQARFRQILTEFPNSAEAKKILALDDPMPPATPAVKKPEAWRSADPMALLVPKDSASASSDWRIQASASVGIDTNPLLASTLVAATTSTERRTDGVWQTSLGLDFQPSEVPMLIRVSGFLADYFEVDSVDFFGANAMLMFEWQPHDHHLLSPYYQFQFLWLSDRPYETQHTVGLEYTGLLSAEWAIRGVLDGGFRFHPAEFAAFDGGFIGLNVASLWFSDVESGLGRMGIGASWAYHDAATQSKAAHIVTVDWHWQFWFSAPVSLNLGVGWRYRSFVESEPDFGRRRIEHRVMGGATVRLDLENWVAVQLSARYAANWATIPDYTYGQLTLQLEWVFQF